MLIYLIYCYQEHGPEDLLADTRQESFYRRATQWLLDHGYELPVAVFAKLGDAIGAGVGRHSLEDSWGGAVVEIVEAPDQGG